MVVAIEKFGFCYFPVPKVANTSIKHLLYQAEHGVSFDSRKIVEGDDKETHIHRAYRTIRFDANELADYDNFLRFTVVRDPVARLISCWRNRVVHYGELSEGKVSLEVLNDLDLPPNPDLNTFALNIGRYMKAKSSIKTHASPLVHFLGNDASYYHAIFSIERLDLLEEFLHSITGIRRNFGRSQTGGPNASIEDLTDKSISHLQKVYKEDYAVFGHTFSSPQGGIPRKPLIS